LTDTQQILPYFLVNLLAFLFLYVFGYGIWFGAHKANKVALLFSSGANNVALGVVISFLYFPTETGVFFVVSEIVWVLVLIPVRKLMIRLTGR
jgi:predicted Na+-dependent transporter